MNSPQLPFPLCPSCNKKYEAEGGSRPRAGKCGHSMCDGCVDRQQGSCYQCSRQSYDEKKDNIQLIEVIGMLNDLSELIQSARETPNHQSLQQYSEIKEILPKCCRCSVTYQTEGKFRPCVGKCGHSMCHDCVPKMTGQCERCRVGQLFKSKKDNVQLIEAIWMLRVHWNQLQAARGAQNCQPLLQISDAEKTTQSQELAKNLRFVGMQKLFQEMKAAIAAAGVCFDVVEGLFPFGKKFSPDCTSSEMERTKTIAANSFMGALEAAKKGAKAVNNMMEYISECLAIMWKMENVVDYTEAEKEKLNDMKRESYNYIVVKGMNGDAAICSTLDKYLDAIKLHENFPSDDSSTKLIEARDTYLQAVAAFFRKL